MTSADRAKRTGGLRSLKIAPSRLVPAVVAFSDDHVELEVANRLGAVATVVEDSDDVDAVLDALLMALTEIDLRVL